MMSSFFLQFSSFELFLSFLILFILIIFFIIRWRKKNNIVYSVLVANHPVVFINDIINAFYYSHMHNKNIKICIIKNSLSVVLDQSFYLNTVFTISLVKFFMSSIYSDFIFFITIDGIFKCICFDNKNIEFNLNDEVILLLTNSSQNNLFDIIQGKIVLKNNNAQKTMHILKEVIKNNIA